MKFSGIRKVVALLLIVSLMIVWGCSKGSDVKKENNTTPSVGNVKEKEDKNQTALDSEKGRTLPSEKEKKTLEKVINDQLSAIQNMDLDLYLKTLDTSKKEYISEKKAWFRDIIINNIDDFSIEVLEITKGEEGVLLAEIRQSYTFNGNEYSVSFLNKYIKKDDKWVDSDLNFEMIETEHFTIEYLESQKEIAEVVAQASESGYTLIKNRIHKEPKDKTVIKIYNDLELLRQSVKLSFAWQFAGWYEFSESIKMGMPEIRSISASDLKRSRERVIAHELTHKITIGEANNNLPYWFAEGLATYFTDYYNWDVNRFKNSGSLWTINELENENLETMTDNAKIRKYYFSSGAITCFIAREYGEEKLSEIVEELGKYDYVEGTGGEKDNTSVERFHEVIPKVLGVTIEELDKKWLKAISN